MLTRLLTPSKIEGRQRELLIGSIGALGGAPVDSYLVLPKEATSSPVTITTNGLEGTVQELLIPLLRHQDAGMRIFVVKMPGTYAYQVPMPAAPENSHHQLIDSIATHLAFVHKLKAA